MSNFFSLFLHKTFQINQKMGQKNKIKKQDVKRTTHLTKPPNLSNNLLLRDNRLWLLLIIIGTFLLYFQGLKNGFVNWDDNEYVVDNMLIRTFNIETITYFFTNEFFSNYHPLTMISYSIEYALFGLNPKVFHLTNLLLHLLNIFLVFLFIQALCERKDIALLTALLFGIHPMHVESVAWISERKDVLYAFFYLGALLNYIKYLKYNNNIKFLIFTFILFLCALLSKLTAVTLPVIMLTLSVFYKRKIDIKDWLLTIPFFILSFIFGIIALKIQTDAISTDSLSYVYSFTDRLLLITYSYYYYIERFIFPYAFSTLHPYPHTLYPSLPWIYKIAPLALLVIGVSLFLIKKNMRSFVYFGMAFFIITITLVVQIVPVGQAIVAERYTYIPYIGLSFIVAVFFSHFYIQKYKIPLIIFGIIYIGVLSFKTINLNTTWHNSLTLWNQAIDTYPGSFIAHNHRALYKSKNNMFESALKDFETAIRLNPEYKEAITNIGNLYFEQKDFDLAILYYDKSLSIDSTFYEAYNNRGYALASQGDFENAIVDYNKAIMLKPDYQLAYNNRGVAYGAVNNFSLAIDDLNKAISLDPKYAESYNNIGIVYIKQNDYASAISNFDKAVQLNMSYLDAINNRGMAKLNFGHLDEAIEDFNLAISINSADVSAYLNRAKVFQKQNNIKKTLDDFQKVIDINPNYYGAYENIGVIHFNNKHYELALDYFKQGLNFAPHNPEAHFNMALTEFNLKNISNACLSWKNALLLGHAPSSNLFNQYCK